jgi:hypothetical protein
MAKQQVTETCEYVIEYPFTQLESRGNDIYVSPDQGVETKTGKLPLVSRRPLYFQDFSVNELPLCEDTGRIFCIKDYVLRAPVKKTPIPPEEDILQIRGVYIIVNLRITVTSVSSILGECLCNSTAFGLVVGDGSTSSGQFSSGVLSCTIPEGCGPGNIANCLALASQFSGRGFAPWSTSVSKIGRITTWSAGTGLLIGCVTGPNSGEQCRQSFGSIRVNSGGVVCSGPGELGKSIAASTVVQGIGGTFPTDWADAIDEDGKWFGWTVINPPIIQ